jgi:hypothetical protein
VNVAPPKTDGALLSSTKIKICWPDVSDKHINSSELDEADRFDATNAGPATLSQVILIGVPGVAAGHIVVAYITRLPADE